MMIHVNHTVLVCNHNNLMYMDIDLHAVYILKLIVVPKLKIKSKIIIFFKIAFFSLFSQK